jgi:Mg-chelatase subunit ChlD
MRSALGAASSGPGLLEHLYRAADVEDGDELWDRLVEVGGPDSTPEALRRAGLAFGWTMRASSPAVPARDLAREAWMRRRIRGQPGRTAVVVGAFHAPALLPSAESGTVEPADSGPSTASEDVVTSLIPYTFPLLDSRSGYPSGIRDPEWQQAAFESGLDRASLIERNSQFAVEIVDAMRQAGHAAGTVDAIEIHRLATDLARLRTHSAPGRRELVEACAAVLNQGELLGRGRAVAAAMGSALVGRRQGRLAPGTPRSGLGPHVEALLAELRLPGSGDEPADVRLDPLRSPLDRRRHVALQRLTICGVPYATLLETDALGAESLTQHWRLSWQPATAAMIDLAGLRGVTLAQAAEGALRVKRAEIAEDGEVGPAAQLAGVQAAAECGLDRLAEEWIRELAGSFLRDAGLAELIAALDALERIGRGHVPGFMPSAELGQWLGYELQPQLLSAAVQRLEGLSGSERLEDAVALGSLVRRLDARDAESGSAEGSPAGDAAAAGPDAADSATPGSPVTGSARLDWALARIGREGSPLMQGAAGGVLAMTGRTGLETYASLVGSWLDGSQDQAAHAALSGRLRGTVVVTAPYLESADTVLNALCDRIESMTDAEFSARLPALREGFDPLSTAGRVRFLQAIMAVRGISGAADLSLEAAAEDVALWGAADREGKAALARAGFGMEGAGAVVGAAAEVTASGARQGEAACGHQIGDASEIAGAGEIARSSPTPLPVATSSDGPHDIGLLDRWRLILGTEADAMSPNCSRLAASLDELYGGHGEGSRADLGAGRGGAGFPTVREWAQELDDLFGEHVREEVLGRAASSGRSDVIDELDPEKVAPSVDLLEQVLSLAGAVPEASLGRLRRLVQRVVDQLVAELAVRVRPALTGSVQPRATRRHTGDLHLPRTITANLKRARRGEDGRPLIAPEEPFFHARGRRAFDWRVVLCVDVSGSMEPSVIYSAMMAAIIAGLPAVKTNFVAFSDRVVDMTDRVSDPLGLLLEVQIGGGTDIAGALGYARTLVTVPARTIVVVVSDFEEGGSTGRLVAEVRALAAGGSRLLGLAALDDRGAPRYDAGIAEQLVEAGMPIAALTPLELARWIGERIHGA